MATFRDKHFQQFPGRHVKFHVTWLTHKTVESKWLPVRLFRQSLTRSGICSILEPQHCGPPLGNARLWAEVDHEASPTIAVGNAVCQAQHIISTLIAAWALLIFTPIVLPAPALAIHRSFAPEAKNWTAGAFYATRGTFFADVPGDGKADAIAVNDDRVWVRRSDGCSFRPKEQWMKTPFSGTIATFFADVTGDRKADAIAVDGDGILVGRSEDGRRANWTSEAFYGERATFFADVTGERWPTPSP